MVLRLLIFQSSSDGKYIHSKPRLEKVNRQLCQWVLTVNEKIEQQSEVAVSHIES